MLVLGGAMLLDQTIPDIHVGRLTAPIVLIGLGIAMMLDKGGIVYGRRVRDGEGNVQMKIRRRGNSAGDFWMIGLGAWMLVSQTHLFGLSYHTSWPILIILSGLMIVIRGIR